MVIVTGNSNVYVIFKLINLNLKDKIQLNTENNMPTKDIKYFGKIENPPVEENYEGSVCFEEGEVELDVSFFNSLDKDSWAEELESYLTDLIQIKIRNEKAITSDYRDGGAVREYIDYHIEDDPMILVDLFDDTSLKSDNEQMRDALRLEHIAFYPGDEKFAVWDYSIGQEYTDMFVVIYTDNRGRILSITWES